MIGSPHREYIHDRGKEIDLASHLIDHGWRFDPSRGQNQQAEGSMQQAAQALDQAARQMGQRNQGEGQKDSNQRSESANRPATSAEPGRGDPNSTPLPSDLQKYLSDEFRALLSNRDFREALPGHLLPDAASQQRL